MPESAGNTNMHRESRGTSVLLTANKKTHSAMPNEESGSADIQQKTPFGDAQ